MTDDTSESAKPTSQTGPPPAAIALFKALGILGALSAVGFMALVVQRLVVDEMEILVTVGPLLIAILGLIGSVGLLRMNNGGRILLGWVLVSAGAYLVFVEILMAALEGFDRPYGLNAAVAAATLAGAWLLFSRWAGRMFQAYRLRRMNPESWTQKPPLS